MMWKGKILKNVSYMCMWLKYYLYILSIQDQYETSLNPWL